MKKPNKLLAYKRFFNLLAERNCWKIANRPIQNFPKIIIIFDSQIAFSSLNSSSTELWAAFFAGNDRSPEF